MLKNLLHTVLFQLSHLSHATEPTPYSPLPAQSPIPCYSTYSIQSFSSSVTYPMLQNLLHTVLYQLSHLSHATEPSPYSPLPAMSPIPCYRTYSIQSFTNSVTNPLLQKLLYAALYLLSYLSHATEPTPYHP